MFLLRLRAQCIFVKLRFKKEPVKYKCKIYLHNSCDSEENDIKNYELIKSLEDKLSSILHDIYPEGKFKEIIVENGGELFMNVHMKRNNILDMTKDKFGNHYDCTLILCLSSVTKFNNLLPHMIANLLPMIELVDINFYRKIYLFDELLNIDDSDMFIGDD